MKAKLYLSKLHQDLIDAVRDKNQFKKLGDQQAWMLCCDGFCCILDFSKFQNPMDLVSRKKDWMSWYIRKEDFGALLWNPDTNRVFELDDEAYKVLMTLQEGTGLKKAVQEYGVRESDLHMLLAQISESTDSCEKTLNKK
ncbi:MAG: hypothetical protein D8M57_15765 [Candidatus Scalindua sp. AMX11]|nr:MAG: hypothetical protein DWQ00_08070 [Candidatus Scalindua sp.]NOG83328.1 hypothetical protein [Planctomycetota bacterium]RZV76772.1 MAG: hypothetical protein EX341_12110 [Candidatus Scalindua sp. SCAELEC01]TDE63956.1 MAG: hypothetical protein D8M57_15765 [Candidatus Scalindua sp. AMX11]GJQ60244.1 MAG: hypothetical protein SCALA701_30450 [Candidatus Scalindua sp.]